MEVFLGELIKDEMSTSTITVGHGNTDVTISVKIPVGLEDEAIEKTIVYPNPTDRRITIQATNRSLITYRLFNDSRKLLNGDNVNTERIVIDMKTYSKGKTTTAPQICKGINDWPNPFINQIPYGQTIQNSEN